jgi:hypothetical protein
VAGTTHGLRRLAPPYRLLLLEEGQGLLFEPWVRDDGEVVAVRYDDQPGAGYGRYQLVRVSGQNAV